MKHIISHKKYNGHRVYRDVYDPLNPLDLPPYTIRLKYEEGFHPTHTRGTSVQVSISPNVWDWTFVSGSWWRTLAYNRHLEEVLGCNAYGVTNMRNIFEQCTSLTDVSILNTNDVTNMEQMFLYCTALSSISLMNTSNVTSMYDMFNGCESLSSTPLFDTSNLKNMICTYNRCTSLTSIPLFNTSKITNMSSAFAGCINVQSGALALYQQTSIQMNPPNSHSGTFMNCGINTQTGSAELAQIPSDWK